MVLVLEPPAITEAITADDLLRQARAEMERCGWTRHYLIHVDGLCLMGALRVASAHLGLNQDWERFGPVFREACERVIEVIDGDDIAVWNDLICQGKAEALAVLEAA